MCLFHVAEFLVNFSVLATKSFTSTVSCANLGSEVLTPTSTLTKELSSY